MGRFEETIQRVPFLVGIREDVVVALCSSFKVAPIMPGDYIMLEVRPSGLQLPVMIVLQLHVIFVVADSCFDGRVCRARCTAAS